MIASDISIRRPVFATVMSLVVVLIGLVSYSRLPVREYPKIDSPVVSVGTTYRGASAEIIETTVTQRLEEVLAGIEGLEFMTSVSRQERSNISLTFDLNRDPSDAAADVRDRVGRARGRLPDEVEEPVISKVEADAQPTIYLALSSDRHSALEITDVLDRNVRNQLQTLPGVAQITDFGDRVYSMRIWLDPDRLAAYRMTPADVEAALRRENVEIPAGIIESREREFTVLSQTDLGTPTQFNEMVLRRTPEGYLVRLIDVGYAELGALNESRIVRISGASAVAVGVVRQATANPLDISKAVREQLPRIVESLPEGVKIEVAYDRSKFIEESIANVYWTIGEAIVLVIAIIFLFLRSLRATLVPLVTIPVSLIGACALMDLFGFSINSLTLLAMVLAIGLVVDDAIVMLENIYRHVEEGMPPMRAAFVGSREIGFAVLAMSLTLAAVYVPIGFMAGATGRLFTEFALTLAGSVIVSGFVALTASPMMCSKLLRRQPRHGRIYSVMERGFELMTNGYRWALARSLGMRPLVLIAGIAVAGAGGLLFTLLPSELAPYEDQGTVFTLVRGPEGATVEYTDRYMREVEQIIAAVPEVDQFFIVAGTPTASQGVAFAVLKPWADRERAQAQIVAEIGGRFFGIAGVNAFAINPPPLGQSPRDRPVEFVMQSTRPYAELQELVNKVVAKAEAHGGFVNVDSDLLLNKPQVRVIVDREKAADLGISAEVLGRTLETLFGGRQVTRFKQAGKQYDVVVRVAEPYRTSPADLPRVYVRSATGQLVQVANLVHIEETVAPRDLNHFNQLRSATISANLADGVSLGAALDFMRDAAQEASGGAAQFDYKGQSREFQKASGGIALTFVLALAFIYLVLAAQFESFRSPLIIMLTVPLSITGGLLALWLDGSSLNIYSQVGLVTLIGLISKHGILIVEFANQNRARGLDVRAAVLEASAIRLRPILMTTGAMVFGALPLAVASGAGAESRQDIGLVVVGGLLVGTFFTLFVIPAVYTYIAPRVHRAPGAEPAVLELAGPGEPPLLEDKREAAE
jgi:multidrug efflux pump